MALTALAPKCPKEADAATLAGGGTSGSPGVKGQRLSTATTDFVIAVVDRGGFHESWHTGVAVLLDADGNVAEQHGSIDTRHILPRSTLKPIYAASMLALGTAVTDERQLALACASNGRLPMHIDLAQQLAEALGIEESELLCPPMRPAEGGDPARIAHMCVGKHIMMRASARAFDSDLPYTSAEHPLQQHLRRDLERLTGEQTRASVADGCGAPVHSTTVLGFARAYRQLAVDAGDTLAPQLLRAGAAMRNNPEVVEAPGKPDTVIGESFDCIAKFGAEGTVAITMPDGMTAVAHSFDGARRAANVAAVDILARHGAVPADALEQYAHELELVHAGARVKPVLI